MNAYDKGDLAHVTVAFTTSAGVATDPTALTFAYKLADDTVWTTLTYGVDGALAKDSVGNYHVDVNCDYVGVARYRWASTGTGQAAVEDSFLVYDSTSLALSLAEAKQHLRIDSTDTTHDGHIPGLIRAAMSICENYLNRYLLTGTRVKRLDSFPDEILLPQPLSSVTSITYLDTADASQTLTATVYDVDASDAEKPCGRVQLAYGQSWPTTLDEKECVTVTFVCGWASTADIPTPIVEGLKLAIQALYDGQRDNFEVSEMLWSPYRWVPV